MLRAETAAAILNARWTGWGWMARCPAHHDKTPSLSIRAASNGAAILKCFRGCDRASILAHLDTGVVVGVNHGQRGVSTKSDAERTEFAMRIWSDSAPANGTLVETYLRSRGITLPVPDDLRFAPLLKHSVGVMLPTMIALVRNDAGEPVAIHRTYLARDGRGKANVIPSKKMLGPTRQGAVRLGAAGSCLLVGEGIETSFSAMAATGIPAWAALSASGLRSIVVPTTVTDITILADGDAAGEAAAQAGAGRLRQHHPRVRIARPPAHADFNDMLLAADEGGR